MSLSKRTTSLANEICSITGKPGTDFLGNPTRIATSLLLKKEVPDIRMSSPKIPLLYLNIGCDNPLIYFRINGKLGFSMILPSLFITGCHVFIAEISIPDCSPCIIDLKIVAPVSAVDLSVLYEIK